MGNTCTGLVTKSWYVQAFSSGFTSSAFLKPAATSQTSPDNNNHELDSAPRDTILLLQTRELCIMHHLSGHPNIVTIKGAYEDVTSVYLVMELCAGGQLFDRIIQRGHYSETKAAELTWTIVGVIEACHSLGVMHRDLKPENVLFSNQGEYAALKTTDFGLSIFFKPGEIFTGVVGSPYYVAPEVLKSELDFVSDPWPKIAESAKDLLQRTLNPSAAKRLKAHQVLCHPWICEDGVAPDRPKSLSEEEITGLKEMFKMMDSDDSGSISFEELKEGLKKVGSILMEEDIRQLMDAADVDQNGTIDYGEFLAATLNLNKIEREENLFTAFSCKNRYLTTDELQQACTDFHMGGYVYYNEFVTMMHKGNGDIGRSTHHSDLSWGFSDALMGT
ncbi:unnamed protein product [Sphagnum jensenii]|uniref:Calcium-dependent protein kinase n=1 Tax=Sphagnum jensenii TaxID=128206 RepID=A0ABP0WGB9_9BRYO